jgi:hypothetical protein
VHPLLILLRHPTQPLAPFGHVGRAQDVRTPSQSWQDSPADLCPPTPAVRRICWFAFGTRTPSHPCVPPLRSAYEACMDPG